MEKYIVTENNINELTLRPDDFRDYNVYKEYRGLSDATEGDDCITFTTFDIEYVEKYSEKMFEVYQYDRWFDYQSRVLFGVFTNKTLEDVKKIAFDGFEQLYKNFKENVYANGTNQWISDEHNFGFTIQEVKCNVFGEVQK